MLFAKRNAEGRIDSLHRDQVHGSEPMLSDHPEVLAFLGVESSEKYQFSSMDARLVRVLEDLVDTLIERNVIRLTDLPEDAQQKLLERKRFRDRSYRDALRLVPDDPMSVSVPSAAQRF
jgi:hypothetical protein